MHWYTHNPHGYTDSCVFVTTARLMRTTPDYVCRTANFRAGLMSLGDTCELLRSLPTSFSWLADGSSAPPPGTTNEYGMLYQGVNGSSHAVVVERVGDNWLIYDYTDGSGRKWLDWSEVGLVAMIFWRG